MAENSEIMMVDEAEGCSHEMDDSGSDGDGGLDDEVMEQISSGELPMSMNVCIALNQVYQEVISTFMRRHVESALAENREKQKSLEFELRSYSTNEGARKQASKVPITLYLPPYFRDSAGLAPLKNRDAVAKETELNMLIEPPKKWSPLEKRKLSDAVYEAAIKIETGSFIREREFVMDDIKKTSNPEELTVLWKRHVELDKKIETKANKIDRSTIEKRIIDAVDWNLISVTVFEGSRTPIECRLAWNGDVDPRINQDSVWTKEEMADLERLVEKYEHRDWKSIAAELGTRRTAFQCFEKYQSDMNRAITKRPWTKEEDRQVREAVQKYRQGDYIPWEQIMELIEGRTRYQVVSRWERVLSPGLKRGAWKKEEDILLLNAVEKQGAKDWKKIAEFVPGRSDLQCRERYSIALASGQRTGAWTKEEDDLLQEGVKQFGPGKWKDISNLLDGRSAPSCRIRYRILQRYAKEGTRPPINAAMQNRFDLRAQSRRKRENDLIQSYTDMVGRAPKLKTLTPDVDKAFFHLSDDVRAMFNEKMALMKRTLALSAENPAMRPSSNRKKDRELFAAARRLKNVPNDTDDFRAILAEEEETLIRQPRASKSISELAELVAQSKALLPPTTGTLKAFRNTLSWHGADYLVGEQPLRRLVGVSNPDTCDSSWTNTTLTRKTTAVMRGYLEERDSEDLTSTSNDSSAPVDDKTVLRHLLPRTPEAHERFEKMRDTFRQLLLWPAILVMLFDEESDTTG